MKNKKISFNYPIEALIKANLNLQSTQRILRDNYRIHSASFESIIRFIKNFKFLEQEKQNEFLKLIGGAANLRKTKQYIEERLEKE